MKNINLLFNIKTLFDYDAICHSIYNGKKSYPSVSKVLFDKSIETQLKKYISHVRPNAYSIDLRNLTS